MKTIKKLDQEQSKNISGGAQDKLPHSEQGRNYVLAHTEQGRKSPDPIFPIKG